MIQFSFLLTNNEFNWRTVTESVSSKGEVEASDHSMADTVVD